jgi:PIN domain nuclease of toxin-antitoxin system
MAIKLSLGRPFEGLIPEQMRLNGIQLPGIELEHVTPVTTLPFHHRDPFDRLIVAQAMVEQMPIVTADPAFDAYPAESLW